MPDPWDRPPFPKAGNSPRILYEAIGRALMAWEEVEGAFAHLYSTFLTGWPFDVEANRQYGEPLNFVHRVDGLRAIACRSFQAPVSRHRRRVRRNHAPCSWLERTQE
jgi:hypothetical protein